MRESFTQLQVTCQDYSGDLSASSLSYFQREINRATRFIYSYLQEYIRQKTATTTTVADQQFYQLPEDFHRGESLSITINNLTPTLIPVDSRYQWDRLNAVQIKSAYPRYYFVRENDFGIFPAPNSAFTMNLSYVYMLKDMTAEDYTTGTVTVTNDDDDITGSGTTWTSAMVGRYFQTVNDGYPYKIRSFTSTTNLDLATNFAGTGAAGQSYSIFESPGIPVELHELIPYRVMEIYFAQRGASFADKAKMYANMFWTGDANNNNRSGQFIHGGLIGAFNMYARSTNVGIVEMNGPRFRASDIPWSLRIIP
jgi:hypothetical protein